MKILDKTDIRNTQRVSGLRTFSEVSEQTNSPFDPLSVRYEAATRPRVVKRLSELFNVFDRSKMRPDVGMMEWDRGSNGFRWGLRMIGAADRISTCGIEKRPLNFLRQVAQDFKNVAVRGREYRVGPFPRHTEGPHIASAEMLKYRRFLVFCLMNAMDDFLDAFNYFNELRNARGRVYTVFSALRPVIGVSVMACVTENDRGFVTIRDYSDVIIHSRRPVIRMLRPFHTFLAETRLEGTAQQVECRVFDSLLFLRIELRQRFLECTCDDKVHADVPG